MLHETENGEVRAFSKQLVECLVQLYTESKTTYYIEHEDNTTLVKLKGGNLFGSKREFIA